MLRLEDYVARSIARIRATWPRFNRINQTNQFFLDESETFCFLGEIPNLSLDSTFILAEI